MWEYCEIGSATVVVVVAAWADAADKATEAMPPAATTPATVAASLRLKRMDLHF
jgi:hypothetical protein